MAFTTNQNFPAFISVVPHGGTVPVLINPAAIATVSPFTGDPAGAAVNGALIALITPNSGVVKTDTSVAAILTMLTPS
ncbi:hypothetical protein [Sphingomonas sp. BE137]|uniref:hypothetical protein n=1 Tax=Sphingomonas sp. BE137 TaxID=2817844 RepID=UPI001AE21A41|nr:hypothetical protein [Sphingomonas sp. BE137]MDR6850355.1 hypothetical protein [Sphingomonas sp. BE137]